MLYGEGQVSVLGFFVVGTLGQVLVQFVHERAICGFGEFTFLVKETEQSQGPLLTSYIGIDMVIGFLFNTI